MGVEICCDTCDERHDWHIVPHKPTTHETDWEVDTLLAGKGFEEEDKHE